MELTALITTVRHGEKDGDGNLTTNGLSQALEKAFITKYLEGDVILFHSGVERVLKTIDTIGKRLNSENGKEQGELNVKSYVSPLLHFLYDKNEKGSYFSNWNDIPQDDDFETKRAQEFVNFHSDSPENNIFPSPIDMAKRVSKLLSTQIDFASITDSSHRTNFINGSHEPVLISFLSYFLNDFNDPGIDFINEIGGSINYAEGFDISVFQEGTEIEVQFQFRDFVKNIDIKMLKEFSLS